jgi:hypothetical protein
LYEEYRKSLNSEKQMLNIIKNDNDTNVNGENIVSIDDYN